MHTVQTPTRDWMNGWLVGWVAVWLGGWVQVSVNVPVDFSVNFAVHLSVNFPPVNVPALPAPPAFPARARRTSRTLCVPCAPRAPCAPSIPRAFRTPSAPRAPSAWALESTLVFRARAPVLLPQRDGAGVVGFARGSPPGARARWVYPRRPPRPLDSFLERAAPAPVLLATGHDGDSMAPPQPRLSV